MGKIKKIGGDVKWFFKRLNRSLGYFKYSWGGYDWDYSYSIGMFQYSLERLANKLDSNGAYGVNAKNEASRCRMISKLMKLVYEDYYAMKYVDVLENMYGKCKMVTEELGDGRYRLVDWKWEKARNDKHNEKINELSREMQKKCEEKQRRAEVLLWKLVEHNIRSFWD
jgi:hypothetical protein